MADQVARPDGRVDIGQEAAVPWRAERMPMPTALAERLAQHNQNGPRYASLPERVVERLVTGLRYRPLAAACCWYWFLTPDRNGYGRFSYNGRDEKVHRVSYMFAFGPIPAGRRVLHSCGVRHCIRPEHLYLG